MPNPFLHKFQVIQFSISTQLSSIWFINRTLSGVTTPARVDLGAMAMKEYSAFTKAPALLEPHQQMFSVISRTLCRSSAPADSWWCVIKALRLCSLLNSLCYLKATLTNVQCSLIQELRFHGFELGHNIARSKQNHLLYKRGRCS